MVRGGGLGKIWGSPPRGGDPAFFKNAHISVWAREKRGGGKRTPPNNFLKEEKGRRAHNTNGGGTAAPIIRERGGGPTNTNGKHAALGEVGEVPHTHQGRGGGGPHQRGFGARY